ncbi:DNA repair protein Rad9,Rhp9 [Desmophyllum pertusum]|uniref:DNA repair protein Rad9,Rhp9 n=1 Tax=Desmophyllum pertusum TaxID=174260 RepID=A0A9W9ZAR7_9CNID|nr:DNA repair protein Rad9,Rhp9 [Desmophyllum pertusum]
MSPDPCENNGTCVDLVNDVNCTCTANYTGKFCEYKVSSCIPNPCDNNATCSIQNHTFTCECEPGFGGTLCANITTVGFNGSSYMNIQHGRPGLNFHYSLGQLFTMAC